MIMRQRLQAILVIASLVTGATGTASMVTSRRGQDFDLVASANPATPHTTDADRAAMFERARGKRAQVDAVAAASATCDGCSGTATAVQVIYIGKAKKGTADNLATAWSSCNDCGAVSVSVQVVVVRPGTDLVARNRAQAVNSSCAGCRTAAVAVQLVVVTSKHRAFTRKGRQELEALASVLEQQLRGTNRTMAARTEANKPGLTSIESLVGKELKPMSVKPRFVLETG
jgi:hypothetical protein